MSSGTWRVIVADCYLDIEWGEEPFAFGEDAWPSPLIRPYPWPEDDRFLAGMPRVPVPEELLDRWRTAYAEFASCQEEFQRLARAHGMMQ
jgi:hypothetical protein